MRNVLLFTTKGGAYFAKPLAEHLEMEVSNIKRGNFSNNEEFSRLVTTKRDSLTGCKAILVGGCHTAKDFWELIVTGHQLVAEGVHSMIVVCPWYRGARQDRAKKPGEAVMALINASLLKSIPHNSERNHFLFMDLHNSAAILGYFGGVCPAHEILSEPVLVESLRGLGIKKPRFATADLGRPDRTKNFACAYYGVEGDDNEEVRLACIDKDRGANGTQVVNVIGSELVKGRRLVTHDDIYDTGGTLCQAGDAYFGIGAISLDAVVPHFACSNKRAIQRFLDSRYGRIVTTNSHYMSQHRLVKQNPGRIIVNDITPLYAQKIQEILQ